MQRHSLIECTYIQVLQMHASETRSCRQIYTASIYIYMYISIVCMYHAWAREAIYYSYAMCLLQGGPTIWACVPGWLVVLQCLLGHVAAMVGAVDAHRCHMGQWSTLSLKAIIVICTCQKHIYIYIYVA